MEGKITAIKRQKGDTARASIFIEEEFAFGVNEQTIEEFRLRKGDYIEGSQYDDIIAFDYGVTAKRTALHYINYRSRSEKEIRERLKKEDIPDEVVVKVLEFLKGYDLVNDEKWAASYTKDRLKRKAVSSSTLGFELKRKGIDEETIAATIAELNEEETDEARAMAAAEKRWPRIVKENEGVPAKQKQKLVSFLMARGFSYSLIQSIYRKLTSETLEDE